MSKLIPGVNFLHQHPQQQQEKGIDFNHVIVDRSDWEYVVELLQGMRLPDKRLTKPHQNIDSTANVTPTTRNTENT